MARHEQGFRRSWRHHGRRSAEVMLLRQRPRPQVPVHAPFHTTRLQQRTQASRCRKQQRWHNALGGQHHCPVPLVCRDGDASHCHCVHPMVARSRVMAWRSIPCRVDSAHGGMRASCNDADMDSRLHVRPTHMLVRQWHMRGAMPEASADPHAVMHCMVPGCATCGPSVVVFSPVAPPHRAETNRTLQRPSHATRRVSAVHRWIASNVRAQPG